MFFVLKLIDRRKRLLVCIIGKSNKGDEEEHINDGWGEEVIRRAEEEEEEGERGGYEGDREGNGAFKAWADQVVDRVGVASQGCVRLACDFEIEWDRSIFLFKGEFRESRCACVRRVDVSKLRCAVHECSSISTLEWAWNNTPWGKKFENGTVRDQVWFPQTPKEVNSYCLTSSP